MLFWSQSQRLFPEFQRRFSSLAMRLPSVKPREVLRVLKKVGFEEQRQTGSHLIMVHLEKRCIIPVPIHAREMKRGLLVSIIKQSGLTQGEFIDLL